MKEKKINLKGSIEWSRIVTLALTLIILFFLTRAAPFPASTYWELAIARDFGAMTSGWVFTPEKLSLEIVNSSASLFGLKAIYHILFFVICALLCAWIFKTKEPLPSIIVLFFFALAMQSFLDFRTLLTLFVIVGMFLLLERRMLKDDFGILLIPVTACASAMGLNAWLLIVLVTCYVVLIDAYRPSLILCALLGLLFFPEGASAAADSSSIWSWHFSVPIDQKVMALFAGILVVTNIVNLGRLTYDDMPVIVFYAITGFMALLNPYNMAVFVLVGVILLFKCFDDIKPLSLNLHLGGIVLITIIVNLFLFANSFGISLKPVVKHDLGKNLSPVLEGKIEEMYIPNYNVGELLWKGIISLESKNLPQIFRKPVWKIKRLYDDEYILDIKDPKDAKYIKETTDVKD